MASWPRRTGERHGATAACYSLRSRPCRLWPRMSRGCPPPRETVLLTVSGLIGNTDRGRWIPERTLARRAKGGLQQRLASTGRRACARAGERHRATERDDAPASLKGPCCARCSAMSRRPRSRSVTAIDGCTGWLTPEDIDNPMDRRAQVNGAPLGIGQQGPLADQTRAPDFKPPTRIKPMERRCSISMSAIRWPRLKSLRGLAAPRLPLRTVFR